MKFSGRALAASSAYLPAFTFLFFAAAIFFPDDPDLGYHLNVGSYVLETFGFPEEDLFRFASRADDIAYSWLANVSQVVFFDVVGVLGLRLWVVLGCFALALFISALGVNRLSQFYAFSVLFLSSIAFIQLATPRPRLWAASLFVGLLIVMREMKFGSIRQLICLFSIVALWSNVHISVVLVPFVLGVFCFVRAVLFRDRETAQVIREIALVVFFAILANPYGYRVLQLALQFSPSGQDQVSDSIIELRGLFELSSPAPVWYWACLVFIGIWCVDTCVRVFWLVRAVRRGVRLSEIEWVLPYLVGLVFSATFLYLSIGASRHVSFFVIAVIFQITSRDRISKFPSWGAQLVGLVVFLFVVVVSLREAAWSSNWYQRPGAEEVYPDRALASLDPLYRQLAATNEPRSILVPFSLGHFVSWWLREAGHNANLKVVLDGRTDKLGRQRFRDVAELYSGVCMDEILERYSAVVVFAERESKLFFHLDKSDDWAPVSADGLVAFLKTDLA